MTKREVDKNYAIEGMDLIALQSMASRLMDGERLTPNQRWDLGQRMHLMLERMVELSTDSA